MKGEAGMKGETGLNGDPGQIGKLLFCSRYNNNKLFQKYIHCHP